MRSKIDLQKIAALEKLIAKTNTVRPEVTNSTPGKQEKPVSFDIKKSTPKSEK